MFLGSISKLHGGSPNSLRAEETRAFDSAVGGARRPVLLRFGPHTPGNYPGECGRDLSSKGEICVYLGSGS